MRRRALLAGLLLAALAMAGTVRPVLSSEDEPEPPSWEEEEPEDAPKGDEPEPPPLPAEPPPDEDPTTEPA